MAHTLPKTILVPIDFSDTSREALHRAVDVAQACSAKLTVIHADEFTSPIDAAEDFSGRAAQSKLAAQQQLQDEVRELVPPDVPVDTMVIEETPVDAILRVARDKNVDWIVMGTHGRSGVRRFVLGSVTESVLRRADRPVLTIRAA